MMRVSRGHQSVPGSAWSQRLSSDRPRRSSWGRIDRIRPLATDSGLVARSMRNIPDDRHGIVTPLRIVCGMRLREHTTWALDSTLSDDRVVAAIVDFGPDRPRIWPETSHPAVYRVHEVGSTWAEVTEGVSFAWSRERYDWSVPGMVALEQIDSNVAVPADGRIAYAVTSTGSGCHIECDRRRTFRATPRGLVAWSIMRTIGPPLLRRQFARSLRRLVEPREVPRADA